MTTQEKPLAERIVDAFKKHGTMNLEKLAERAGTSVATLYTMMGTLKKNHGVARLGQDGRVALYGLGKAPKQKRAPAAAKPRREKSDTSDALGATVRDLKLRREALMADISKLDRAIEAVEALAA